MNTAQRIAILSRVEADLDAAHTLEQRLAETPRWRVVKRFTLRLRARRRLAAAAMGMRIHDAGLRKVATPPDLAEAYTPSGARLTAAQSYRSGGTGPLITEYRRVQP